MVKRTARPVANRARALRKSLTKEGAFSSDRRLRFRDLSVVPTEERTPNSSLLQFYSSANNIGNYLPVLGIQGMLDETPDTWCAHDENIDFDFINAHYEGVIIGGAGLLHKSFEPFWRQVASECNLPMVIWGVGICVPDDEENPGVPGSIVADVVKRCDLVNVRDELTANWYEMDRAQISPCPTIAYLDDGFSKSHAGDKKVLFSMHRPLISSRDAEHIERVAGTLSVKAAFTNNRQSIHRSVDDVIEEKYVGSRAVVTTRLHGAIIAYGMRIPYVAIPRDEKIRSFHARYANGVSIENISEIKTALEHCSIEKEIDISSVYSFGQDVRNWHQLL